MIAFIRGDVSTGTAQFNLSGRHADGLMVLLGLNLERTRTDAGVCVTIQPLELTNGQEIGRFERGEEGHRHEEPGLFDHPELELQAPILAPER